MTESVGDVGVFVPKKVLVLGSTGMAGHLIGNYLHEGGHDVTMAARTAGASWNCITVDVLEREQLDALLSSTSFDIVVNCVGALVEESNKNPENAVYLNSYLPLYLASFYRLSATQVIHLSTDCVFSGNGGAYAEDDPRDGQSLYDRSKSLGEIDNGKDLTLRMSIIGPEIRARGTGLMHWFLGQNGKVDGYTNAIWNGISTLELAKAVHVLLDSPLSGIYHLVPELAISKFELLSAIQISFSRRDVELVPNDSVKVNKTLVDTRQETPFVVVRNGYQAMIDELRDWTVSHPALYDMEPRYQVSANLSSGLNRG